MRQTVYHRCGHESSFHSMDNRNQRITMAEEMGKEDCHPCMVRYAYDNNLPDLEGSDRQIVWAFEIRHNKLSNDDLGKWDADEADAKYWIDRRHKK